MKKLLFLSLMLMAGTLCFGQGKDYVKWEEFKPDVVNYLKTNFKQNQDRYVGQKVSKLVDEIEIPFTWIVAIYSTTSETEKDGKVWGIFLTIPNTHYDEQIAIYEQGESDVKPIQKYYISIRVKEDFVDGTEKFKPNTDYPQSDFPSGLGELTITRLDVRVK